MWLLNLIAQLIVVLVMNSMGWTLTTNNHVSPQKKLSVDNFSMPVYFVKNSGQYDDSISYYGKGLGHGIFFSKDAVYLVYNRNLQPNNQTDMSEKTVITANGKSLEVVKLIPCGFKQDLKIVSEVELNGKLNYLRGNNQNNWFTDIPIYERVRYQEVYDGVDIVFYGNQTQIEYDVVVKPGADLSKVVLKFEGIESLNKNEQGDLVATLSSGVEIVSKRPHIYQVINGQKRMLQGDYVVLNNTDRHAFSFVVEDYSKDDVLVIDPVLSYSTFIGGSRDDVARAIAVDEYGNVYITGWTDSTDIVTHNALRPFNKGKKDVFVTKLSSDGKNILFSTYLGGSEDDFSYAIALDKDANIYLSGYTSSQDFPTTDAFDNTYNGKEDAFVVKLSSDGKKILYSTFIGGSNDDRSYGIAVDSSGSAYITGYTLSSNFPIQDAFDESYKGKKDVFITKLSPDGKRIIYSTYIGGTEDEEGYSIAVDSLGSVYVTGYTKSHNYPTKNPFQGYHGKMDVFLTKLSPDGRMLVYSTYLGGSEDDFGRAIAIDSVGNAYITGETKSSNFPTKNPLQGYLAENDVFVVKLSPDGQNLVFSTYLGGSADEVGRGITVDAFGTAYIIGETNSYDFPIINGYDDKCGTDGRCNGGKDDAFVAIISSDGKNLLYSTFLGGDHFDVGLGIKTDLTGNIYVTGWTASDDFPTLNAFDSKCGLNGNCKGSYTDVFLTKLGTQHSLIFKKFGKGTGTVMSNPSGISCGDDCMTEFDANTSITLIATTATGSVFLGWGGDCAACETSATCNIVLNTAKTCTVAFHQTANPLPLPSSPMFKEIDPAESDLSSYDKPIVLGPSAKGLRSLDLQILIPGFTVPMDLYLAIYAPDLDPNNLYLVTSDGDFVPFTGQLYLKTRWKANITRAFWSQPLAKLYSTSSSYYAIDVPPGRYEFYLLAMPAGRVDPNSVFYLWKTGTVIK